MAGNEAPLPAIVELDLFCGVHFAGCQSNKSLKLGARACVECYCFGFSFEFYGRRKLRHLLALEHAFRKQTQMM